MVQWWKKESVIGINFLLNVEFYFIMSSIQYIPIYNCNILRNYIVNSLVHDVYGLDIILQYGHTSQQGPFFIR